MTFLTAYLSALPFLLGMMTLLWIVSIFIRNVSIVDLIWGAGFVVAAAVYYFLAGGTGARTVLVIFLIIRVSGVFLLEKSLRENRPGYREYMERTSAFLPWFPRQKS